MCVCHRLLTLEPVLQCCGTFIANVFPNKGCGARMGFQIFIFLSFEVGSIYNRSTTIAEFLSLIF